MIGDFNYGLHDKSIETFELLSDFYLCGYELCFKNVQEVW